MDRGATVTKAEAACLLEVSRDTLDKWIESGVITPRGGGGVDRASLDEVAARVERLRESGKNHSLLGEALNRLEHEDPGSQQQAQAPQAGAEADEEFVSAAPGADWDPED